MINLHSENTKLAITALRLIVTGLAILAILGLMGILKLSVATIKVIAYWIKELNDWCDRCTESSLSAHHQTNTLRAIQYAGLLQPAHPQTLITASVLPSSGVVIVPTFNCKPTALKKRGRPKKSNLI
jgi:cell division protein FtsW (lipid II flippase)